MLVLDHYFDQDLAALRAEGAAEIELRSIPYSLLRSEALRIFPPEVAGELEVFARPELEPQRRAWSQRTTALLEEQFALREFDCFVSPSDIFFYVRAAPEACHRLGVPFLVIQKETTVADYAMKTDVEFVRDYAPPIADGMTVCSERQRKFWLLCGARPETVTVTGQPRFDYYAGLGRQRTELGYGESGPVALFFSYEAGMYHPSWWGESAPVWKNLLLETEAGLWSLVERGWRVLIKPHPQQAWEAERRRIEQTVGQDLDRRVFLVDPGEDARRLIGGADVVIGFQTTALLESMVAGIPVVYTNWDPEATRLGEALVPFHDWGKAITVVDSAPDLPDAVERAVGSGTRAAVRAREIATEYLGPVDGRASRRTLEALRKSIAEFEAARSAEITRHRAAVAARWLRLALRRRARASLRRAQGGVARVLDH